MTQEEQEHVSRIHKTDLLRTKYTFCHTQNRREREREMKRGERDECVIRREQKRKCCLFECHVLFFI